MLKFDLARKYLVGLIALSLVLSTFILPASAVPSPTVNGAPLSVTLTQDPDETPNAAESGRGEVDFVAYTYDASGAPSQGTTTGTLEFRIQEQDSGTILYSEKGTWDGSDKLWEADVDWDEVSSLSLLANTVYDLVAAWDPDGDGFFQYASAYQEIEWVTPAPDHFTVDPLEATNDVGDIHTTTVTVKDQWDEPIDAKSVTGTVVDGPNDGTSISFTGTDTTGVYTGSYSCGDLTGLTPPFEDTIVITVDDLKPQTVYKTWTYEQELTSWTMDPTAAANYVEDEHTLTFSFFDQYGLPMAVTGTIGLTIEPRDPSLLDTIEKEIPVDGETAEFTYSRDEGCVDDITASFTGSDTKLYGLKYWIYEQSVGPEFSINALGADHVITITGAPYDFVEFAFEGWPDPANLEVINVGPPWWFNPWRQRWFGWLGPCGTAQLIVRSEIPGQYYIKVFFDRHYWGPSYQVQDAGIIIIGGEYKTIDFGKNCPPREDKIIKVSKDYAQITKIVLTPTCEIDPITQSPSDYHEVTGKVLGQFPVKPHYGNDPLPLETPDPAVYGPDAKWGVCCNELFIIDAWVQNVSVDWKVTWIKNPLNPSEPDRVPSSGTTVTDEQGTTTFTYQLYWNGSAYPKTGSCTKYFCEMNDTITATAHYPEPILDTKFGTPTAQAHKTWRDYSFKVIKYNGHVPTGQGDLIPDAKLYLKVGASPGTAVPYLVKDPILPANFPNAYIWGPNYTPPDARKWIVVTDANGVALWLHLPYGHYYLFEDYVPDPYTLPAYGGIPGYTGYEFIVSPDSTYYWCSPDKQIVHYLVNTPTSPDFWKITFCGTKVAGVQFEVTNIRTGLSTIYTSDANGHVVLLNVTSLPGMAYSSALSHNWYRIHEIPESIPALTPPIKPVADFYFFVDQNGKWNDKFYSLDEENPALEVWGRQVLFWNWDNVNKYHWVIDQEVGATEVALRLRAGWNFITPGVYPQYTASSLFGATAWHWNPFLMSYDQTLGLLEPGKGYWVYQSAAKTVTVIGDAASSPFSLDLGQGWNQLGNPFPAAIPIGNVKIVQGSVKKTLAEAETAGWIGKAYTYNGTDYEILSYSTGTLPVGDAFWLRVIQSGLKIEFTK